MAAYSGQAIRQPIGIVRFMKKLLIALALLALFLPVLIGKPLFQTPTGALISGATSGNVVIPVRVDANGSLLSVSAGAGGLSTDYNGVGATITTLNTSAGVIVMSTASLDLQEIRCNNKSASTANLVITDTAGNLFTGEITGTTGFAIPSLAEDYPIPAGSHIRAVGLKMYSNVANAINCVVYGKQ